MLSIVICSILIIIPIASVKNENSKHIKIPIYYIIVIL